MEHTEADIYRRVIEKIGYTYVGCEKSGNIICANFQRIVEDGDNGWPCNMNLFLHFTRGYEKVLLLRENMNNRKNSLLSKSLFETNQLACFREAKIEALYDSYL